MKELTGEHAFVHENMAAYLAGGLDSAERGRFDAHINACPECFDAFSEARDADRALQRTLGDLLPRQAEGPGGGGRLEERLTAAVRAATTSWWQHSARARRVAYATAAAVALAATGVFANVAMRHGGRFNNPLTEALAASADGQDSDWGRRNQALTGLFEKDRATAAAPNLRGISQSMAVDGDAGREVTADSVRHEKVAALLADARKLYNATQFKEASDLLRQATIIDPQDQNAALLLRLTMDKIIDRQYEDIMHRTGQEGVRQSIDTSDRLIPYADLMVYPDNWPELSKKRLEADRADSSAPASITAVGGNQGNWGVAAIPSADTWAEVEKGQVAPKVFRETGKVAPLPAPTDMPTVAAAAAPAQSVGNFFLAYNDGNGQDVGFSDAHANFQRTAGGEDMKYASADDINLPAKNQEGLTRGSTLAFNGDELNKTGGGTLVLGGGNIYAGPNNVSYGTLRMTGGTVTVAGVGGTGTTALVTGGARREAADISGNSLTMGNLAGSDFGIADTTHTLKMDKTLADLKHAAVPVATTQPGAATPATAPAVEGIQSLKIIRNGTIEFEVRSFDDAYQHIAEIATLEHGYVSSTSSEKLANGHVRGTVVVRVPPERLDVFLISLRSLGDLKAQQIGAADVTKQYYDIESELRGLTTMETRLLDLIKNGKGEVKDLIEAESKLGETRVQIEKLKGEISYYNNLVSLATITITAYEKDIASPTAASEQENVNVNVETEEVEAKYTAARKIFDDAKGRIVESQLKNTDAEHVAAHIVAEVPPAQADFVANQLKQLGLVASFNRDRRQTTTGGTGAPDVHVEQKDTRFTVELFNLANLQPRETTVLRVAVKDVEASYKSLLALVKSPPAVPAPAPAGAAGEAPAAGNGPTGASAPQLAGRVLSSNLTGQVPEQMSADIRAEMRADNADAILAALRNSGEVLTSQLNTNQDNANTTSAKRGLQVTLVNIASVSPKEADALTIAVRDVDGAYKNALALLRKNVALPATPTVPGISLLPATAGRVISSGENGQQPVQMTADLRAELRADQAADVLAALKASGEVISSSAAENPDATNVTQAKLGLMVHLVNVAAISPREVQELHGVAANVADSYRTLLASLQDMAARGDVRIVGSSLSDTDPRTVSARLTFEAQKSAVDAVEKAFAAAGLEFPARSVTRAADSVTALDTKVGYQISDIRAVETLDPKRTITLGMEVEDVEKAVNRLRTTLLPMSPKVRESDFTVTRDAASGRVIAHLVYDTYVSATPTVISTLDNLNGIQKSYQESRNPQAPETKSFTKERVDLTLTSRSTIVAPDQGIGTSARAALSSAAGALLYSVYLVLTGLLFVLPFALIAWPVWAMLKRRKAKA